MGGPIDPRANPTEVNRFAEAHSLDWFERIVITTVPGALSRRVPPGLSGLSAARRFSEHESRPPCVGALGNVRQSGRGDGDSAAATRAFYKEYSSVMDLPADFYLQTIKRVFHDDDLAQGRFRVRGCLVEPAPSNAPR